MNKNVILKFVLAVNLVFPAQNHGAEDLKSLSSESIDREINQFSSSLAAQVRKAGVKKITILDLTDIDGKALALGSFVAEEVTVDLVSSTNTFSVVDRANLNKILAEAKLSRTGLEEPENIKKLGHISGVDAIVLGTLTPLKDEIRVTAKILSTETALILGAARGRIPKTEEITRLLAPPVAANLTNSVTSGETKAPPNLRIEEGSKQIDDLFLKVESMKLTGDEYNGTLLTTVFFKNMSPSKTIGIGMFSQSNVRMESNIVNDKGDEFALYSGSSMSGLPWASSEQYLTDIKPGGVLEANLRYSIRWNQKSGNFGPYRLQATILVGDGDRGRYSNVRKLNFNLNIPTAK